MFARLQKLTTTRSFFLFGARSTGKSTLLEELFPKETTLWIDLLESEEVNRFSARPSELEKIVTALPDSYSHVLIDEIQKVPELLNEVQRLMRKTNKRFIMSGSSARKLKKGGANLLAGRAFVFELFPLTHVELGNVFSLQEVLQWGSLPEALLLSTDFEKQKFLEAYVHTYLKEEIWDEHFVRDLPPFRRFLEVAAQSNGKIVNFTKIGNDVGVDDKTVQRYFSILEDTLIGFFLDAYQGSFRKRLSEKPKFYFFDTGVQRALCKNLTVPLREKTTAYGDAFEHLVVLEIQRLANYYSKEFKFSYLRTPSDVEIDLIIERPQKPLLAIEIKSTEHLLESDISKFIRLTKDMGDCEAICLSRDRYVKKYEHVICYPYLEGIKEIFI